VFKVLQYLLHNCCDICFAGCNFISSPVITICKLWIFCLCGVRLVLGELSLLFKASTSVCYWVHRCDRRTKMHTDHVYRNSRHLSWRVQCWRCRQQKAGRSACGTYKALGGVLHMTKLVLALIGEGLSQRRWRHYIAVWVEHLLEYHLYTAHTTLTYSNVTNTPQLHKKILTKMAHFEIKKNSGKGRAPCRDPYPDGSGHSSQSAVVLLSLSGDNHHKRIQWQRHNSSK